MRRSVFLRGLLVCLLAASFGARGEEGRIFKVLPQYLDKQGRHTISASLFGRDAYQAKLRKYPQDRGGMRMAVEWNAHGADNANLKLRVELRGLNGNRLRTMTLEKPVVKEGWFRDWSELRLTGTNYDGFGELVAWRASLWDGSKELSSQQSFLWNGVTPSKE